MKHSSEQTQDWLEGLKAKQHIKLTVYNIKERVKHQKNDVRKSLK